jgi:spore germination protein YaaH
MSRKLTVLSALLFLFGIAPALALAATSPASTPAASSAKLQYGGWLPFWQAQAGEQDVALHLASLNEVSLFSYEISNNGALIDSLNIGGGGWTDWLSAVKDMGVKVIPTIAWFDPDGIEKLLSNTKTRQAEEASIAQLVTSNQFDGIDIDFEGMYPATRPYYSLFIEGLAMRLHPLGKKLTCTVVPRAPLASLYAVVPTSTIVYPENYTVLNQYCDEVRLMAYDQETTDIQLNVSKGGSGTLYAPVADPDWVKKIIQVALQSISPKKIMLGVPTYGYEYEVSWANGQTTYQRVRAFDFFTAMDRANSLGITPVRDNAGELSFTYSSTTYIPEPPILTSEISSTEPAVLMNTNPNATTTFFVSFPDAQSEADKIALAKQYGLRGVMFFKVDGDIDPEIWNIITPN